MNGTTHTPKLAADVADGKRFLSAIKSAPEDKLVLASAIAEAFINGMITQERLAAPSAGEGLQQDTGQASA